MARPKGVSKAVLEDFRNFLFLVWQHLCLPPPTPVQYEIAEWLQHGPKRQIVEAFRGVGKSWITSAFVIWSLLCDPQKKFMVVSASKQRADDFSTFTLRLINEMPMLHHLRPKDDQRESKIAFDVGPARAAHAPSVKSVGVFGQLTGGRATHIIADDVEVPNNSGTQDMREKLLTAVLEFEAIIVPGGRITYLGTPQTEETVYNKLGEKGYEIRIWPARAPQHDKLMMYRDRLSPTLVQSLYDGVVQAGDPVDPKRFTDMDLLEREASYGRSGFALQFMLDTTLSDAERYPLKLSDLIVMNLNVDKAPISIQYGSGPQQQLKDLPNVGFTGDRFYGPLFLDEKWCPYEGAVMAIDPSGRGQDETGFAIVKYLHGYLWVTAWGGLKGGYGPETLELLARLAVNHKVNQVIIEANFGDGMFTQLFLPYLQTAATGKSPVAVEEVKHSIQKEKRLADTLEPVMNQHKLVFDKDVVKADTALEGENQKYSGFYQMTRLTRERGALRFDDRLDALAIAVNYWVQAMARDERKAVQDFHNRELEKELKLFMRHALGTLGGAAPGKPKWDSTVSPRRDNGRSVGDSTGQRFRRQRARQTVVQKGSCGVYPTGQPPVDTGRTKQEDVSHSQGTGS